MSAASRRFIERAIKELDKAEPSHELDHVAMYLHDALTWLDGPDPDHRPTHSACMIGRTNA